MTKKVLILHGWGGSDYPHWQSHLAIKLIENNYTVSFPLLPNKDNPNLKKWLDYLDVEMKHFKPDIVVCHSLANILWFHYVNNYDVQTIEKLMMVAPVSPTCQIEELKTFFPYLLPSDLKAKEHIIASSDNDPYMSLDEAYRMRDLLETGLKIMKNAGHINSDSGFGRLDCAYDWIAK